MPLYGASNGGKRKTQPKQKKNPWWMKNCSTTDEDGCVLSLTQICLLSLADNINSVWVKDYAEKYLDQYLFRHIMGPFNFLCAELVEELLMLLCTRKKLSRGALDLLLVPQLRSLSLENCPGLASSAVCAQIAARCQLLSHLDFSGAQQLPSKVLSQTLHCLPKLRSLSLAGTSCDKRVVMTVAQNCALLRHLDVSRCHLLSPSALLPLGRGAACPSFIPSSKESNVSSTSGATISSMSPLPLNSLLALDIGFGEQESDAVAVAAYLLLTLPGLEKLAIEGLAQACHLILHGEFDQTDEFTNKEEVPRMEEVYKQWTQRQGRFSWKSSSTTREIEEDGEENGQFNDSEEDTNIIVEPNHHHMQEKKMKSGDHVTLRLRDVRVLSCKSLASLGQLCPNIHCISVNADFPDTIGVLEGVQLTKDLQSFSGQLKSLSLQYSGFIDDLLGTMHVVGSSLVSLTLEGVKTFPDSSLLEVLQACPKLIELAISAEHADNGLDQEEDVNNHHRDWNLIHLSNLRLLTLNFSYEHSQMKPNMSWMPLKAILRCLLAHSPLLQKISLVSLPCPLNCALQDVIHNGNMHQCDSLPLGHVQHLDLQRTDVQMITVKDLIKHCKRLKYVNVSYCWEISCSEWMDNTRSGNVQVLWM